MPLIALPGIGELVLIFGVVVLLFGAKKLPALGGAVGESIKNFKKGVKAPDDEEAKKLAAEGGEKKDPTTPEKPA